MAESRHQPPRLKVEVAYALHDRQVLLELEVEDGTTVKQAIVRSGIRDRFPEIRITRGYVGIFGRQVEPDAALCNGDRVEIYRPLIVDPKEARLRRVKRAR